MQTQIHPRFVREANALASEIHEVVWSQIGDNPNLDGDDIGKVASLCERVSQIALTDLLSGPTPEIGADTYRWMLSVFERCAEVVRSQALS